jgi:deoxynucleoside kinase
MFDRYCFSELARRQGTLHEAEFTVIAEWYKWLEEHSELPLDLIIYLRTTPDIVFERMQSRGRSEESTVPLQYLTELHETYEDWLIRRKIEEEDSTVPRKYKVIVIDANKNKTEVAEECRKQITEFLESYKKTDKSPSVSDAKNEFEASPAKSTKV